MEIDLTVRDNEGIFGSVDRIPAIALHLLRETIDDLANRVEKESRRLAPKGETGDLKRHPVDREDSRVGEVAEISGEIEGRRSVRGAGGRFVPGLGTSGRVVASAKITVAKRPEYAKWVHNGTGLFGPRGKLIEPHTASFMVFTRYGKNWRLATVKGQRPQPYLEQAFTYTKSLHFDKEFEKLKREIDLAT
jgi:hypothetical protein